MSLMSSSDMMLAVFGLDFSVVNVLKMNVLSPTRYSGGTSVTCWMTPAEYSTLYMTELNEIMPCVVPVTLVVALMTTSAAGMVVE